MSSPHPDPLADMLTKPHELDGKFESQAKTVTKSRLLELQSEIDELAWAEEKYRDAEL